MNDGVQVIVPRQVPLGGPRSMTVRRTLPPRERSFVGAWCFVDHYGPDDVSATGGMDVAPHPHCGLATVSWLFTARSSTVTRWGRWRGAAGEVNLMTAGRGISHSEVSTPSTTVLHGAQLWLVLPTDVADVAPRFEHHVAAGRRGRRGGAGAGVRGVAVGVVVAGAGRDAAGGGRGGARGDATVVLPVPDGFEVSVLVDTGSVTLGGTGLARGELGVVGAARHPGGVSVTAGAEGARVLVLGGEPFGEEVVMWWNFIGRSNDDVVAAREAWEGGPERFGVVEGYVGPVPRIPAPALPGVRLKPRGNRELRGGSGFSGDTEAPALS